MPLQPNTSVVLKKIKIKKPLITLLSLTLLASISTANARTITATVTGDQYPVTQTGPGSIVNGDFLITDKLPGYVREIGDGNNERTNWQFDFLSNFNGNITREINNFLKTKPTLCSAMLSLEMHPGSHNGMKGDVIGIVGLRALGKGLPFRQNWWPDIQTQKSIQFDLLGPYSAEDINNSLGSYPMGMVYMRYFDDALISKAILELNYSKTGNCAVAEFIDINIDDFGRHDLSVHDYSFEPEICDPRFCDPAPDYTFIPGDEFVPGDQFIPSDAF